MLIWFVLIGLLIISIVGLKVADSNYLDNLEFFSIIFLAIAVVGLGISTVAQIGAIVESDAYYESNKAIYDSLVYQIENEEYDDAGKAILMEQITSWNSDLAKYRKMNENPWLNTFTPNWVNELEFIEYENNQ